MDRVNIKKAMKNDAAILSMFITAGLFLGMGVIFYFLPDVVGDYVPLLFFGIGLLGGVVGCVRIIFLRTFISDNKVYKAIIIKRYTYRSTRYIKFEYEVDGIKYKKTNGLFANKHSRDFNKGAEIEILISDRNPKRALIRDLYFD